VEEQRTKQRQKAKKEGKAMRRGLRTVVRISIFTFVAAGVSAAGSVGRHGIARAQQAPPFAITSTPPTELNPGGGGPAQASLQQAAEFSWQEFFALNWPAGPQSGQLNQRDTPSATCAFGDQSSACAGPLVWETFRAKVEIFPGTGQPPGYTATAPSYGYDAIPQYNYGLYPKTQKPIVACPGALLSLQPVWVNLDETDQITLDSMYAGVVTAASSTGNSAPQLVRFLAKANRAEYAYVAGHQWWDGSAPTGLTAQYVKTQMKDPTDPNMYVLLPNNSIEVKAGWRVLNPDEITKGRFHTTTVQYYEKGPDGITPCYQQATFGLVALHIIQKTPLAPYFIYATFEQADNILDQNGRALEDDDGTVLPPPQSCRADQTQPCPTTPSVTLDDTAVVAPTSVPPQVVLVPPGAAYCTTGTSVTPANGLFYLNTENKPALPSGGYICVNKRDNDIPQVIIDTNKTAHALMQKSVWQHYKLVNVQYQPIDKQHASLYGTEPGEDNFLNAHNPSTYYQANLVVETNRALQLFSGGLVGSGGTGSNSDYASQFPGQPGTTFHYNMFYQGAGYNMGGCMGCHGSQGQSQGGDFSVIMAVGPVTKPEIPAAPTDTGAALVERNRFLK